MAECNGETLFSALAGLARNADERLKWSVLLQLETETKAWLRAPMVAHGVSIEERTEDRDKGLARARERASLPWSQAMQSMYRWPERTLRAALPKLRRCCSRSGRG